MDDFDVSEETGKVISVRITAGELQELYVSDLDGGEAEKVSDFNGEALKDTYVALPEKITFMSEGWDIDGWVLKPFGFDLGKKYPQPFGNKAAIVIHKGGAANVVKAKYAKLYLIYNKQSFTIPSGITMKYIKPD